MAVPGPRHLSDSPVEHVRQLQALIGSDAVARWCAGLVAGTVSPEDPELPPLSWFGAGAANLLKQGDVEESRSVYWVRVWGARGLLHGWQESAADVAEPAILAALTDDAWRVREMAAKVVRRWQIDSAAPTIALLLNDETRRVRAAAEKALVELTLARPRSGIARSAARLRTSDNPNPKKR